MADDVKAGRLDTLVERAKAQVAAGQYQPLGPGKPLTP